MKVHKKLSDLLFRYLLFLFTIVTVIAVIMIGVYMFQSGGPSIAKVGIKLFVWKDMGYFRGTGKVWNFTIFVIIRIFYDWDRCDYSSGFHSGSGWNEPFYSETGCLRTSDSN